MALTKLRNSSISAVTELPDTLGNITADQLDVGTFGGRRNLIINGGFQVWQRGTSFANSAGAYTVDRWTSWSGLAINVDKVSDGMQVGFDAATEKLLEYKFEELDAPKLHGKTLTLSIDADTTSMGDGNANCFFYGRNSSNTWSYTADPIFINNGVNKVTFTVPDDADLTRFRIRIANWNGSAYSAGTLIVKNIQLEFGDVNTPFEQRSYGEELALCQRYFEKIGGYRYAVIGHGAERTTTQTYFSTSFKVEKRATPSVSYGGNVCVSDRYNYDQIVTGWSDISVNPQSLHAQFAHPAQGAEYKPHFVLSSPSEPYGYITVDAEL